MKQKQSTITIAISIILVISAGLVSGQNKYCSYVNPFVGTAPLYDSAIIGYTPPKGWRPWAGLTFPGSSLPNAMVQLSPVTEYHTGSGYQYEDTVIYGFTHTNKGHWNLCNIPVLPVSNTTDTTGVFKSRFNKSSETASPAFYKVRLEDYGVTASFTSTLRCGFHRYQFTNNGDRRILFDLSKANNRVRGWKIEQVDGGALEGYQDIGEEKVYFYVRLNKSIESLQKEKQNTRNGYAIIKLSGDNDTPVELKIGLSYVSTANAKENLQKEIGEKSFETVLKEGVDTWEALLSTIEVTGGSDKQKRMFYSSLYRSFLWPALRSDVNGEYTDAKRNTVKGNFRYYTTPSLWDDYRNKLVLLGIVSPGVTVDVIKSLVDVGDKTGFIPTFFHGDHAASFIAGSYLKGITGFDVDKAYRYLLKNANEEGGPRPHISEYIAKGYVPDIEDPAPHVETKGNAGVSKTLEYAFDDYSLGLLAKKLGDTANERLLMQRSQNYKHVFDAGSRFMRGKKADGQWIGNFNPQYPYYEYMYREANAWQVTFFVPHDMDGLVNLYGGPAKFEKKLDSFYSLPWNPNYIARNVESMIGQYCHGNQPDHEAPFAYHFIGKPEKSQRIIDHILDTLYGIGPDGLALCGMDDAGEMSSWYVFCAMGIYPYSATDPRYIVTVPVFDSVSWKMNNGKTLVIKKNGTGRALKSINVNRKQLKGYFISHDLLKTGGLLEIGAGEK